MGGVEEADEIPDRKERGVAQAGTCGVISVSGRNFVINHTEHIVFSYD